MDNSSPFNKCDGRNQQRKRRFIPESEDEDYFNKRARIVSREIEREWKKEEPSRDKRKNNDASSYTYMYNNTDESYLYISTFV